MNDADSPINYMQRTRDWYLALGYGNPYRWAHYADAPFQPLGKALAQATVALIMLSLERALFLYKNQIEQKIS